MISTVDPNRSHVEKGEVFMAQRSPGGLPREEEILAYAALAVLIGAIGAVVYATLI